jgi:hypothetical protein
MATVVRVSHKLRKNGEILRLISMVFACGCLEGLKDCGQSGRVKSGLVVVAVVWSYMSVPEMPENFGEEWGA